MHLWAVMISAHLAGLGWTIAVALAPVVSWVGVVVRYAGEVRAVALFGFCAAFWVVCVGFAAMAAKMARR